MTAYGDQPDVQTLRRRNRWFFIAFLFLSLLTIAPATGLFFNRTVLVVGVPLSVLWLSVCFTAMAVLAVVGYRLIFRHWSRRIEENE